MHACWFDGERENAREHMSSCLPTCGRYLTLCFVLTACFPGLCLRIVRASTSKFLHTFYHEIEFLLYTLES